MLLGMMGFQLSLLNHSSSSLAFTVRHHDNHHLHLATTTNKSTNKFIHSTKCRTNVFICHYTNNDNNNNNDNDSNSNSNNKEEEIKLYPNSTTPTSTMSSMSNVFFVDDDQECYDLCDNLFENDNILEGKGEVQALPVAPVVEPVVAPVAVHEQQKMNQAIQQSLQKDYDEATNNNHNHNDNIDNSKSPINAKSATAKPTSTTTTTTMASSSSIKTTSKSTTTIPLPNKKKKSNTKTMKDPQPTKQVWRNLELKWSIDSNSDDCDVEDITSCSEPCLTCRGAGITLCAFCHGVGYVDFGMAEKGTIGERLSQKQDSHGHLGTECPICNEDGETNCGTCRGSGWIANWRLNNGNIGDLRP